MGISQSNLIGGTGTKRKRLTSNEQQELSKQLADLAKAVQEKEDKEDNLPITSVFNIDPFSRRKPRKYAKTDMTPEAIRSREQQSVVIRKNFSENRLRQTLQTKPYNLSLSKKTRYYEKKGAKGKWKKTPINPRFNVTIAATITVVDFIKQGGNIRNKKDKEILKLAVKNAIEKESLKKDNLNPKSLKDWGIGNVYGNQNQTKDQRNRKQRASKKREVELIDMLRQRLPKALRKLSKGSVMEAAAEFLKTKRNDISTLASRPVLGPTKPAWSKDSTEEVFIPGFEDNDEFRITVSSKPLTGAGHSFMDMIIQAIKN